eukprot:Tbor_TRINITY_DN3425_c0_g1::TRINITY_DN3425_c0_g1_i1::g.3722::m.3722
MILRRPFASILSTPRDSLLISTAYQSQARQMSEPGWRTKQSTKDARTKEQKEIDRRVRQIDKLPKSIAVHDYQYPYDKTILSDRKFQPTIFDNHLDSAQLFHSENPHNFFLYWNCKDFDRSHYPHMPAVDHRLKEPCATEVSSGSDWVAHRILINKYFRKHEIIPAIIPYVSHTANLSVVFSGVCSTTRVPTDENGEVLPPPPPEDELTNRNFWFTSHCGNYIDLHQVQQPPAIFFRTLETEDESFYTLIIACPDYPYRTDPNQGHLVNYIVSNIPGCGDFRKRKEGVVVVPYVPPLPTEDAGTVRQLCMLFKQRGGKIDSSKLQSSTGSIGESAHNESKLFNFERRSNYRMHDESSEEGRTLREEFTALTAVENCLEDSPAALSFFQTKWDIQVQEYYEKIGCPEPAFQLDDELQQTLHYLSLDPEELRVRSRYLPDGSVINVPKAKFWSQRESTRIYDGTATQSLSRRTLLGDNRKEVIRPQGGHFMR